VHLVGTSILEYYYDARTHIQYIKSLCSALFLGYDFSKMIILHVFIEESDKICWTDKQMRKQNYISCSGNVRVLPKYTFKLHNETDEWNSEAGKDRILKLLQLSFPHMFNSFRQN
jgi:hypothetical protein